MSRVHRAGGATEDTALVPYRAMAAGAAEAALTISAISGPRREGTE